METLAQTTARIQAILLGFNPKLDLSPNSVLNELLTGLMAQAQNEAYNTYATLTAGATVQSVLASAVDTYSPIIDSLATNYNVTRLTGSAAKGFIKVTVTKNKTYNLPSGTIFVQPSLGFNYVTTLPYTINATSAIPLVANNGTYSFTLPVVASSVGAGQQVGAGTQFTLLNPNLIPEFVTATALGAFSGGADKETDKQLIARFQLGLTAKNLISPAAILATLQAKYASLKSVAVVGSMDAAQTRNSENPLGIRIPGAVDVYIRNSTAIPVTTINLPGTSLGGGNWSITIPPSAVPGFYSVVSIVANESNGTSTVIGKQNFTATFGYDNAAYTPKNQISSTSDARFSVYQTCEIMVSTYTSSTNAGFTLTLSYQPNIADIQAEFLSDASRIPCADYLVKGVVPCNVSVNLTLKQAKGVTINTAALQTDIFNYINNLPVGEPVNASKIVSLCHNYGIERVELPVVLTGDILLPYSNTGANTRIESTDYLAIPNNPAIGVTPNTTAFFANYFDLNGNSSININLV